MNGFCLIWISFYIRCNFANYVIVKLRFLICLLLASVFSHSYGQDTAAVKKIKPITLSGTIGLQLATYNTNAETQNFPGFSWMAIGNPTVTLFEKVSIPFNFIVIIRLIQTM
jgi:hypothetical protein